jgi:sugar phosphate isomerase/epimerase
VPKRSAAVSSASVDPVPDRLCLLSSAVQDASAQVVAERARDAGFHAIEWGIGPGQVARGARSEVRGLLELSAFNGLEIVAVTVQGGRATLDTPASIKPVVAFAAALDAPFLRLWTPGWDGGPVAAERKTRRAALARAIEITAAAGVVLLLENHPDSLAPSTTLTRELIDGYDPAQVGVLWDPGNGIIEGHLDPRLAIADLGDYLHHVHVKNIAWRRSGGVWSWSYAPLATGMLDWSALLAALQTAGYRGRLSIDHLPGASSLPALRRELRSLRALLAA